jgi:hypothetical protein
MATIKKKEVTQMRKLVLVLGLLAIGGLTAVYAEEMMNMPAGNKPMPKSEMKHQGMQMRGTIASMDEATKMFSISAKDGKTSMFSVTDKTMVMEGKKKISMMDCKVGDKVKVSYKMDNGKMVATSIHIMPMKKETGKEK